MSIPLIIIGLLGTLISVGIYQGIRTLRLMAILVFFTSIAITCFGLFPNSVEVLSIPTRMRLVMAAITFTILYVTLEAVRRTSLKERYALLWIGTSGICFVFALYPNIIELLVRLTGMHYLSTIMVIIFSFLILVVFHFSLVLSRNEDDRKRLVQTIALLQERIEKLETREPPSETESTR